MIAIGADMGGTSLRVALYQNGQEQARSEGPGASMRPGDGTRLAQLVAELVRPLMIRHEIGRSDILVVGAAGAGAELERDELRLALERQNLAWRVVATSDAELARLAAFGQHPGLLLIAGTGSIVVGRDARGEAIQVGGLGWRMGDQGSGYWIGVRGLEAVGAMHDHLGPVTHLAERLAPAVGAAGIAGLVRWSVAARPTDVAALAPIVVDTAAHGDTVAQTIVSLAIERLTALALGAGATELPVALTGGLLDAEGPLRDGVARLLRERGAHVLDSLIDPCRAAVAWE